MRMWRWYFGERAHITGVDIEPATRVYQGNPRFGRPDQIVIGDQSDPAFWERFKREVCGRGGLSIKEHSGKWGCWAWYNTARKAWLLGNGAGIDEHAPFPLQRFLEP